MANWVSMSVSDVITQIRDEQMVLPVIQRRLVWNEEKMELLFDSLLKGNSFGSVICIEEEKNATPLFAFRKFTDDGNNTTSIAVDKLPQAQFLIIDGQQRLQSFLIGLTGHINGERLYFDLLSDFASMEFDFKFESSIDRLPKKSTEKSESAIQECLWYPVADLYKRLADTSDDAQIAEEIMIEKGITDDAKEKCIDRNIRIFYGAIFSGKNIGLSKVSVNKTKNVFENRQRIVELFRRLNDGGTKLSSFDLVASVLKSFDYKMEAFLDTVVDQYKDIGLAQDNLIKLLFILNDTPMKEMVNLQAKDAKFATDNSERVIATLAALRKFLIAAKLSNYFLAEKNRSFIPLYFLAYHIFHSKKDTTDIPIMFDKFDTNDKEFIQMKRWLYLSLLNGAFSRGRGWIPYKTGIRKIHSVLVDEKGSGNFPTDKLFYMYAAHPLQFTSNIGSDTLASYDRDVVLYLIYDGQPTLRSEDIDHIHPRSLLERNGIEPWNINSVINFQLLDSGTNRGAKQGKALKDWLANEVLPENKVGYLTRHLIPTDIACWELGNFDSFLLERAILIADKLNVLIN